MSNDRSKLPRWAQIQIDALEGSANYHKRRLNEAIGEGGEGTDTIVYMGHDEKPIGLPNGVPIRFQTDHGAIEARVVGGRLEVHSSHGGISIRPIVTNSIELEVIPR